MEMLKTILTFISSMAYPVLVGIAVIMFRKELAAILVVLRGILKQIEDGKKSFAFRDLQLTNTDPSKFAITTAANMQSASLNDAAKTIQELLSPAAPLALGYVDNFLAGFSVKSGGGFQLEVAGNAPEQKYNIQTVFTIYIPRKLPAVDNSQQDLVRAEYAGEDIKNILIASKYGRPFTGFAVFRAGPNVVYPVDVPKTLTSIQHVFRYREDQLRGKGMEDAEIKKLENENLNEFAAIIEERTKDLRKSGTIRVIRERSELFSPLNGGNS